MKLLDKYIQKKIDYLNKNPEKNKTNSPFMEDFENALLYLVLFILFALFVYFCPTY